MTRIRTGTASDHPALREIQSAALAEPWPELLETACSGPPPLFVRDDEGPVGYVIVIPAGERAHVPELAVHPDRQGEGHGSALLSFLFDYLDDRGVCEVRLTVEAADERARGFYESRGFEIRDRLVEEFESGDGLLLGRQL